MSAEKYNAVFRVLPFYSKTIRTSRREYKNDPIQGYGFLIFALTESQHSLFPTEIFGSFLQPYFHIQTDQ